MTGMTEVLMEENRAGKDERPENISYIRITVPKVITN